MRKTMVVSGCAVGGYGLGWVALRLSQYLIPSNPGLRVGGLLVVLIGLMFVRKWSAQRAANQFSMDGMRRQFIKTDSELPQAQSERSAKRAAA